MKKAKKTKAKKARAMTLFEVLLVMAIVGIALGGLAWKLPQARSHELFQSDVQRVISKLTLAQELMLDLDCDVKILFTRRDKGDYVCEIEPDLAEVPAHLKRSLNLNSALKEIRDIRFNDKSTECFVYKHTTCTCPSGQLTLKGGVKEVTFELSSYPCKISKKKKHVTVKATFPKETLA